MFEFRFTLLPPPTEEVDFRLGKYDVSLVMKDDCKLRFELASDKECWYWHPEAEARYLLSWLGLTLRRGVRLHDSMIIDNSTSRIVEQGTEIEGMTRDDLVAKFEEMICLGEDRGRRFLRACYIRNAAHLNSGLPEIAYVMLVAALECASSRGLEHADPIDYVVTQMKPRLADDASCLSLEEVVRLMRELQNEYLETYGARRRFSSYVREMSAAAEQDKDQVERLAKAAYDLRSSFVHSGKNIEKGFILADKLGKPYVRHLEEEKRIIAPGLRWLMGTVDDCLNNSIDRVKGKPDDELVHKVAVQDGIITGLAKREVKKGQFMSPADIDLT